MLLKFKETLLFYDGIIIFLASCESEKDYIFGYLNNYDLIIDSISEDLKEDYLSLKNIFL